MRAHTVLHVSTEQTSEYAGQQLGMPADGPGSMAPLWRRALGLLVDWVIAQLISTYGFGTDMGAGGAQSFVPLAVLAVINVLSITAFAATPGQALLRMQVLQVRAGSFPLQVAHPHSSAVPVHPRRPQRPARTRLPRRGSRHRHRAPLTAPPHRARDPVTAVKPPRPM